MVKATPDNNNFQFSVKVPETTTYVKCLRVSDVRGANSSAMTAFEEFFDKILLL
jgi:uncharacterized protein YecE (DUF72 family)